MTPDDKDLEDLFQLARASRTETHAALTERVLADAMASLPRLQASQVIHRPTVRRNVFGLDWLQVSGLALVGVLGVMIGVLNPGFGSELSPDSYSLADLMPGLQDVLGEEGEG